MDSNSWKEETVFFSEAVRSYAQPDKIEQGFIVVRLFV